MTTVRALARLLRDAQTSSPEDVVARPAAPAPGTIGGRDLVLLPRSTTSSRSCSRRRTASTTAAAVAARRRCTGTDGRPACFATQAPAARPPTDDGRPGLGARHRARRARSASWRSRSPTWARRSRELAEELGLLAALLVMAASPYTDRYHLQRRRTDLEPRRRDAVVAAAAAGLRRAPARPWRGCSSRRTRSAGTASTTPSTAAALTAWPSSTPWATACPRASIEQASRSVPTGTPGARACRSERPVLRPCDAGVAGLMGDTLRDGPGRRARRARPACCSWTLRAGTRATRSCVRGRPGVSSRRRSSRSSLAASGCGLRRRHEQPRRARGGCSLQPGDRRAALRPTASSRRRSPEGEEFGARPADGPVRAARAPPGCSPARSLRRLGAHLPGVPGRAAARRRRRCCCWSASGAAGDGRGAAHRRLSRQAPRQLDAASSPAGRTPPGRSRGCSSRRGSCAGTAGGRPRRSTRARPRRRAGPRW